MVRRMLFRTLRIQRDCSLSSRIAWVHPISFTSSDVSKQDWSRAGLQMNQHTHGSSNLSRTFPPKAASAISLAKHPLKSTIGTSFQEDLNTSSWLWLAQLHPFPKKIKLATAVHTESALTQHTRYGATFKTNWKFQLVQNSGQVALWDLLVRTHYASSLSTSLATCFWAHLICWSWP